MNFSKQNNYNYHMDDVVELDKLIPHHPQRKKVYQRFLEMLTKNIENTQEYNLQKISLNIERGIFNVALNLYSKKMINETWNNLFKNIYLNKAVMIYDNLDPNGKIGNTNLLNRLLNGDFTEFEMCSLSSDKLYPERHAQIVEMVIASQPKVAEKQEPVNDGIFKCGKCKSYKTEYTEKQTRSADEPSTKFCYCHNCGNRWKFC